jgi:hypothetical protein
LPQDAAITGPGLPRLTHADQLPKLRGRRLFLVWEVVEDEAGRWVEVRKRRTLVWREPVVPDGIGRFEAIVALLHERYGDRLTALEPTHDSFVLLCAEDEDCAARISAANARLTSR